MNTLNKYMASLNSNLEDKREFCERVDSYIHEAWGGCPKALFELGEYLWFDYPYQEMADYFIEESAKLGYPPAVASIANRSATVR
jgi:hypothetical protein